jgi:SAM-dependent methyltransferase
MDMVGRPVPAFNPDWDFYADPAAVADYIGYREQGRSRNSLLEEPDFLSLIGPPDGLECLDLGCGYGHYCEILARTATSVIGIDRSELMITQAERRRSTDRISYRLAEVDEVDFPAGSFDLVISNLTLHYLDALEPLTRRIFAWLRAGGRFVFSVEHPVFTATRLAEQWCDTDDGRGWMVSDYFAEDGRWGYFGKKFHHTIATWIETPLRCGFRITGVAEPSPHPPALDTDPSLAEDLDRPLFLIVACAKPEEAS